MYTSQRRIVIILAGLISLWLFFPLSSDKSEFHDNHGLHKPLRFPGRPDYLPFHPPPLQHIAKRPKDPRWAARANSVKEAFLHAYRNYERYAPFPNDELLPLTNESIINFNGWGLTLVDSLDTMYLLGLTDDFKRAVSKVETLDFSMARNTFAPFFETVIRYLGGLLSAYALSHDPILLARAEQLGEKLLPAFDTASGLPVYAINTQTKETRMNGGMSMLLAEIASCQMEYKYLTYLTGREEFFTTVEKVMDHMKVSQPAHGMWPTTFDLNTGKPINSLHTVGAWADSAYEYLLKQYLLSGKTEHRMAKTYMKAIQGILENLVFLSHTRNLLYITDTTDLVPSRKFEHLSCFFPGLLALGATTLPEAVMSSKERELHMWAAEGLAHTCWIMYADQPSGLGAEIVLFDSNTSGDHPGHGAAGYEHEKWMWHLDNWEKKGRPGGKPPGVGNAASPLASQGDVKMDYTLWTSSYLLRPETLESMLVLYRTTGDAKWRDRGWQIWEAIESKTRTYSGYASVYGVDAVNPPPANSMPSYFLAETVKYAYLIALDEDPWPIETFILNTEAHPLPVFKWGDWQRRRLGVDDESVMR